MTITDYASLCRYDTLLKNMYAVTQRLENRRAGQSYISLPWATVLLLGAHNAKHIYVGNTSPDQNNIKKALNNFSSNLKLSWHYSPFHWRGGK